MTLQNLLEAKDRIRFQQARNKWIKDGDTNSSYFHKCAERKGCVKEIKGFRINGRWLEGVKEVKEDVKSHFESHFTQNSEYNRLPSEELLGAKLNELERSQLEEKFLIEEIKQAVWECGMDKCPGPDGFNFHFFSDLLECCRG